MEHFFGGFVTIVGHPLDTIKVLLQNNKNINYNFKLFNGLTPIIITNSIITGVQFHAIILGLISAALSTPIEYYKIQKTLPKGFIITFIREFIALNCYFNLYNYLENKTGIFVAGGLAGSTSWLLTYQIDTIKTRIQSGYSFNDALKEKNFNKGLYFCLIRGFIVNAFGYLGASQAKNLILS